MYLQALKQCWIEKSWLGQGEAKGRVRSCYSPPQIIGVHESTRTASWVWTHPGERPTFKTTAPANPSCGWTPAVAGAGRCRTNGWIHQETHISWEQHGLLQLLLSGYPPRLIGLVPSTMCQLDRVWHNKRFKLSTKLCLQYPCDSSAISTVLLHGSEKRMLLKEGNQKEDLGLPQEVSTTHLEHEIDNFVTNKSFHTASPGRHQ